jgi:hypothetical protein
MRAEDTAAFGLKLTDLFVYMWHVKCDVRPRRPGGVYLRGGDGCMDTIRQQASSLVIFTNSLAGVALPICGHSAYY